MTHRRVCSANQPTALNNATPIEEAPEDFSGLVVGHLTFYCSPRHKRFYSYGGDVDSLMQTVNEEKLKKAQDSQRQRASLKRKLLELIAVPPSEEETERNQAKPRSSRQSGDTEVVFRNQDNRETLVAFLERKQYQPTRIAAVIRKLGQGHYALLLVGNKLKGVYQQEANQFNKVSGSKTSPRTLSNDAISHAYLIKGQHLQVVHPDDTPDLIIIESAI